MGKQKWCQHGYRGNPDTCVDCRGLSFAGMETADQDRAEALAVAQAEELSAELRRPLKDISRKAGQMERESPLFYGQINPTLF